MNILRIFLRILQICLNTLSQLSAMSRQKKSRHLRRIGRRAVKDYKTIMKDCPPLLTNLPPHEWLKSGDFFAKFTLYDESQISYTTSGTSYVAG